MLAAIYRNLVGPCAILVMVLAASVLFVASPVVWEAFYQAPEKLEEHGYSDGVKIAKHLWDSTPYREVSAELQGGRLGRREVAHYEDLQHKFSQLLTVFYVSLLLALPVVFLPRIRRTLWLSLSWLAGICVVSFLWALYDWKHFFHTLHWWIFQNDSWKLPWGCYSLQLYPYPVWKGACVIVVSFSVVLYLLFFALSFLKKKTVETAEKN